MGQNQREENKEALEDLAYNTDLFIVANQEEVNMLYVGIQQTMVDERLLFTRPAGFSFSAMATLWTLLYKTINII